MVKFALSEYRVWVGMGFVTVQHTELVLLLNLQSLNFSSPFSFFASLVLPS